MARSERQKLKLLYLRNYLLRNTDEQHPVTMKQIIAYLDHNDIPADILTYLLLLFTFYFSKTLIDSIKQSNCNSNGAWISTVFEVRKPRHRFYQTIKWHNAFCVLSRWWYAYSVACANRKSDLKIKNLTHMLCHRLMKQNGALQKADFCNALSRTFFMPTIFPFR